MAIGTRAPGLPSLSMTDCSPDSRSQHQITGGAKPGPAAIKENTPPVAPTSGATDVGPMLVRTVTTRRAAPVAPALRIGTCQASVRKYTSAFDRTGPLWVAMRSSPANAIEPGVQPGSVATAWLAPKSNTAAVTAETFTGCPLRPGESR